MKRILVAGLMALLFAAAPAMASVKSYTFNFAGNGATASGIIVFDMALLKNPGRNLMDTTVASNYAPYGTNIPGLVTSLSLKVSGASAGNGNYVLNDFEAVLFDTSLVGVNLNAQLVGQSLANVGPGGETWSWGANHTITGSDPVQSYTGDFQLFSSVISPAPYGSGPFQLTTAGGEDMQLTSLAAVPEPSTWLLVGLGMGGMLLLKLKKVKREG